MMEQDTREVRSPKRNIEAIYPLSPMQQGMIFHSLYEPESGAYFEQFTCVLRGNLNVSVFESAWREVIKRQSVLRTSFVWKRLDKMLQVVQKDVDLPMEVLDWRGLDRHERDLKLQAYLAADRSRGFDLSKPPLMRLALIAIDDTAYFFVWSHHHAIMDGWSMPLLLKDVLSLYFSGVSNGSYPLSVQRPYRDYIAWLQEQDSEAAQEYWVNLLTNFPAPTPLVRTLSRIGFPGAKRPEKRPLERSEVIPNREMESFLSKEETQKLSALARRERLTISTLIQAAWSILLSRYTGERDVVFGATVSGRPTELAGAENMIGLFINTLPIRVNLPENVRLLDWLGSLQSQAIQTRQYEYSSLVQIQEWSEIPRGMPLFESILVFENYPVEDSLRQQFGSQKVVTDQPGIISIQEVKSYEQTNYPLTIVSGPGDQLGFKISYDPTLFAEDTISRLSGNMLTLLTSIAAMLDDPEVNQICVDDLPMLTPDELNLLASFADKYAVAPEKVLARQPEPLIPVHELISRQAKIQPEALALLYDDSKQAVQTLSYAELDQQADLLGNYLSNLSLSRDGMNPPVIGLYTERSIHMVVGLLGILKSSSAYLPLDPYYPLDRIMFMLADTGSPIILTQSHLVGQLAEAIKQYEDVDPTYKSPLIIPLDSSWDELEIAATFTPLPSPAIRESTKVLDNLAYIVYTSGSTGKPKGVMVEHRSLVNHALNFAAIAELSPLDRVLQFISVAFDASAEEFFPTLISGATLVLPAPSRELITADLCQLLDRNNVSVLHLPAAYWHQMVDDMISGSISAPGSIRLLVVGGESPSKEKFNQWNGMFENRVSESETFSPVFINAYGPTETTIAAAFYVVKTEIAWDVDRFPIGRGLVNNQLLVVDTFASQSSEIRQAPLGATGEIFVGGAGVARGYLNHPELTAEKFISKAFTTHSNGRPVTTIQRFYRTGDLGRYLPDGNIEFLGRADQQVKIRGYRIELGEIETALNKHPWIGSVVVIAREDQLGLKRLVAYIIADKDVGEESQPDFRKYLLDILPDYMAPSAFVVLEKFPVTTNGKIDRRALESDVYRPENAGEFTNYVAPRTPIESLIVGVWEAVLKVPRIGIYDNFYNLGGHSLIATQAISRLRSVFEIEIPLRLLLETLNVADLAKEIEQLLKSDMGSVLSVIEPMARQPSSDIPSDSPQLSFSQQRLWFLDQLSPGNLFYNIPLAVEISGELDVYALKKTLNEIVARHAVLRTNFKAIGGSPIQVIHPQIDIKLPVIDLSGYPPEQRQFEALRLAREEAQKTFDLERDALLRAAILHLDQQSHVFLLTMHHIISDGWSMGVFLREVVQLYPVFSSGAPSPLPALKLQYFDFANWQRSWLQGEELERQMDYWKKKLEKGPRLLDLPTDRPRPAIQSSNGATFNFNFSVDLSEKLVELSRQEGVTLFMTLLAGFQLLLSRYSGQDDISVGTAIANRNRTEIEGLIGFFVNTLVMRTDLSGEPSAKELLKRVREVSLGAYAHQDMPFEMLVEALQPGRDLSHTPLFQVAFALQNAPVAEVIQEFVAQEPKRKEKHPLTANEKNETGNGLSFKLIEVNSGTAKFDMTLTLAETPGGLVGGIEYNQDLFNPDTIERLAGHYRNILDEFTKDINRTISQLPLLTPYEQREILVDWNATDLQTPSDRPAHELFEIQVSLHPDQHAVCFEDQFLTYAELDRRANQLAVYLRSLGVGRGESIFIGISTERSLEMIVGILGVLKSGGAYVPLDPTYPADRLAYMIQDSGVPILLTQEHLLEVLPLQDHKAICLDSGWGEIENFSAGSGLVLDPVSPDNLAYMIYTSGSTGKPKGTMLRHRGLSNLAEAQRLAFGITENSRVLQFSPLSFDASVWETFMALANGATLILARQNTLASRDDLLHLLKDQEVTTITLPPSVLRLFSQAEVSRNSLPALTTVISAGEACTPDIVAIWKPGRDFFNAYGPTETTVCASMYRCEDNMTSPPPIGRPIPNTRLYILDKYLQPVPVGVPAELHVSGISLAVGYLNQPTTTSEKFLSNPYSGGTDRLYKTGDLARYRSDGNIDFLGRIDQQVKLRGFRIELGEIESALGNHPSINDVAVVTQNAGEDKRLVAYVVTKTSIAHEDGTGELKSYLRKTLPEYMIPTQIVEIEQLPLSPSGKVDRKALAELQVFNRPELKNNYIAPRNEIEEWLVEMSAELLHLERVGVQDNFFELGGHSLLATQFVSRVRDEYGIDLPLRRLFENPTISSIAEYIKDELGQFGPDSTTNADCENNPVNEQLLSNQGSTEELHSPASEGSGDGHGPDPSRSPVPKSGKSVDRATLTEMLLKVGELSDEQVKALLDQKKQKKDQI